VLRQRDLERFRSDVSEQFRAIMLMLTFIDRKLDRLIDDLGWDDEEEDHT
jgi:hypothetical protein